MTTKSIDDIFRDDLIKKAGIDVERLERKIEQVYTPEMLEQIVENLVMSKFKSFIILKADEIFNSNLHHYLHEVFYNVLEVMDLDKTIEVHAVEYIRSQTCADEIADRLKLAIRKLFNTDSDY